MRIPAFLRKNPRLVFFGFACTFFASLGQTVLIGLFVPSIRDELGLDSSAFGGIYSTATLGAALLLGWSGAWIDRMRLERFVLLPIFLVVSGSFALSMAETPWLLLPAFLLLRLGGQGLLTHTAQTTLARHFQAERGRVIGIASLGHPIGESFFTFLLTAVMLHFGWRAAFSLQTVLALLLLLPLVLWLLRSPDTIPVPLRKKSSPSMNRRQVLSDRLFYTIIPVAVFTPFFLTGLFFHQGDFLDERSWKLELIPFFVLAFNAAKLCGTLLGGFLVDRYSARLLFPLHVLPMLAALALISLSGWSNWDATLWGVLLFAGGGITVGMGSPVKSALWAESYGTDHLGAIRSMTATIMVFATALSPLLFGLLIDSGLGWGFLTAGNAVFGILLLLLAMVGLKNVRL